MSQKDNKKQETLIEESKSATITNTLFKSLPLWSRQQLLRMSRRAQARGHRRHRPLPVGWRQCQQH